MENLDLENFPTSESAKRMLSYVSDGFYDKSYVGKWVFQVMGEEYDHARKIVEELPDQFFPETATWGLMFHEIKWGLPVRENLSYEERRRLIYQKRDTKAPMIPYRMEEYLKNVTGFEVRIADVSDPGEYGFVPPHPNVFKAYFIGDATLDSKLVFEVLDRLKQSHTAYTVNDRMEVKIDNQDLEQMIFKNIRFGMKILFWRDILNPEGFYQLLLRLRLGWEFHIPEQISPGFVQFRAYLVNNAVFHSKVKHCFFMNFWKVLRPIPLDEKTGYGLSLSLDHRFKIEEAGRDISVSVETKTRDYWFLDGKVMLDGSRKLNSIYRKETVE